MSIDLMKFCTLEGEYFDRAGKPFSHGEWTYATNNSILVRVPRIACIPDNSDAPDVERIWPKEPAINFRPAVDVKFPANKTIECDCFRGNVHNCPSCTCICERCGGTGEIIIEAAVYIGKQSITEKDAKLILSLPVLFVAEPAGDNPVVQFKFKGGEGLLATLRSGHGRPMVGEI